MAISKITNKERDNVRISGLADRPGLTKEAMQQRFDGLGDLAIDKVNELVDQVNDLTNRTSDSEGKPIDLSGVIADLYAKIEALRANIPNIVKGVLDEYWLSVNELPEDHAATGKWYVVQGEVEVN